MSKRRTAADDERRRYYRITPFGTAVARAEMRRLSELVRLARAADSRRRPRDALLSRTAPQLYPERFRDEYRDEMCRAFAERTRGRSRVAIVVAGDRGRRSERHRRSLGHPAPWSRGRNGCPGVCRRRALRAPPDRARAASCPASSSASSRSASASMQDCSRSSTVRVATRAGNSSRCRTRSNQADGRPETARASCGAPCSPIRIFWICASVATCSPTSLRGIDVASRRSRQAAPRA